MGHADPWIVLCSDLSRPCDYRVRWCASYSAAVAEAKELNRLAIARAGGDARRAPLYYCCPADTDWKSRTRFTAARQRRERS